MRDNRDKVNIDGVPASAIEHIETWDIPECECGDFENCDFCR